MFSRITINNFRGYNQAALTDLTRINIITGRNGAGKTSLLEAVFLISGGANASLVVSLNALRGENIYNANVDKPFRSIFKGLNPSTMISLEGVYESSIRGEKPNKRTLQIKPTYSPVQGAATTEQTSTITGVEFIFNGPSGRKLNKYGWQKQNLAPNMNPNIMALLTNQGIQQALLMGDPLDNPDAIMAAFISPYARDIRSQDHAVLTQAITERRIDEVINVLKIIQPSLIGILPLSESGIQMIYADIGGDNLLPINLLGSGFSNFLHIMLPILSNKNSLIMIDEFEDGLHYLILNKLLKTVFDVARDNNNQIFISTHSKELLLDIVSVATEHHVQDEVSFYRLNTKNGDNNISRYSVTEVSDLIEAEIDLR